MVAFIWWFDKANEIYDYWRDGLRAALEEIGKDHDVDLYLGKYIPEEEYESYLIWDDSNSPAIDAIKDKSGKKGIILTTMPQNIDNLKKLDVIFCESQPVYDIVKAQGLHAVKAFGTDTDFFSPDDSKKDIEYFYPATFSPWKKQSEIAHLGEKLWCVGTVQPDGIEELEACRKNNVHIAEGYFRAEHIRDLYRRSKKVIIPAVHGSERTVLEAMSCGIEPYLTNPDVNYKAYAYIKELQKSRLTPREFVLKYYSAKQYAEKIVKYLC